MAEENLMQKACTANLSMSAQKLGKHLWEHWGSSERGNQYCLVDICGAPEYFQWTYGIFWMTGEKEMISLQKIKTNPIVLSFIIGVVLFLLSIPVPAVCMSLEQ